MALQAEDSAGALADVVDRILDKGLVINADIAVTVVGVQLLGIRIRAALASFETAARYGLEFPSGVNLAAPGWQQVAALPAAMPPCPRCGRLLAPEGPARGCPACGWAGTHTNGQALVPPVNGSARLPAREGRLEA